MAGLFGVLAIIQGIVLIALSNDQEKKGTNIIIGLVFIGVGIALTS